MAEQLYKQHIDKLMAAVQPMNEYKNTFISHCKEFGPRISTGILVFDKALNGGLANDTFTAFVKIGKKRVGTVNANVAIFFM